MTDSDRREGPTGSLRHLLEPAGSALPCGREVDELLEQIADGRGEDRDAHQRNCPHCQAALAELAALWQPVRELAAEPVQPPAMLAETVMRRVHQMVNDVWYTLQLTELGSMKIAARVVARLARDTARQVPGVRVALGRSTQSRVARIVEKATLSHRHPHAAVGVLGRTAAIDLAIAVSYGEPVHDVAREVQQQVTRRLREAIGLESVTVNVTVDDVLVVP